MGIKDGRIRKNVLVGAMVQVVQKVDQSSSKLTKGEVAEILTPTSKHPHGIKVRLRSGLIGRVRKILSAKKRTGTPTEAAPIVPKIKLMPWESYDD
jgi:uncharacterized repeat protein (TIGR03833 family)